MKLQGVFVPVATPFDHRGDLYITKIHYNVSRWNRTRVAGYMVGSSCGEARTLSLDEKKKLWEEAAKEADSEKLLLAGVSLDGVKQAARALECAHSLGYKAGVAEPPQYPCPWVEAPETQALFFRALADQSKIPVVIANPRAPAVRLNAATIAALARHPNILGVVEHSDQPGAVTEVLQAVPEDFQVLGGDDTLIYTALAAGAVGVAPALANAAPFYYLSIDEAVRTRELASAAELQQRTDAAALAISTRYGIAGLKYAMDLRGYYGGSPRLPLVPAGEEAKVRIAEAMHGVSS